MRNTGLPLNDGDESKQGNELSDTGRAHKAVAEVAETVEELVEEVSHALKTVRGEAQSQPQTTSEKTQPPQTWEMSIMKHINECPAVQGYNKLKFAVYICTGVLGAFVGLALYLGPGAFKNAINEGVNKAMDTKMPSIRSYIEEQVVITTHNLTSGRTLNFDPSIPWRTKQ